jgi:hypothetical protein
VLPEELEVFVITASFWAWLLGNKSVWAQAERQSLPEERVGGSAPAAEPVSGSRWLDVEGGRVPDWGQPADIGVGAGGQLLS